MSNEEVDRTIAFIIQQQAQFTSDIQQLREVQAQLQATQVQRRMWWDGGNYMNKLT